jgi:hypothetical protein
MHATCSINLIVLYFIVSRFRPRFGFYRHTKQTRYLWHHVRFDVEKVTQGQVSLRVYCFFPSLSFHTYPTFILPRCATSRTVPGSIPGGVTGDFFRGSFRQNHVTWGRLRLWKRVPEISSGVKAADAHGWRPTTIVVPNVEMIRGLNLPGTPRATSACRGTPLLFYFYHRRKIILAFDSVVKQNAYFSCGYLRFQTSQFILF